jgi:Rrf2 family protein
MISQTSEYALRAMSLLASLEPDVAVNCETIAERIKVPPSYLSKILRDLVVAELVRSQRGPNGGFCLASPAAEVSILDIINAVDPIQRIKRCPLGNPQHVNFCPLHSRLDDAMALCERHFAATNLAELLQTTVTSAKQCGGVAAREPRRKSPRRAD